MEPHTGRAEHTSSPSMGASLSMSLASGVGLGSPMGSWPLFSLVGKHREGFVQFHQQPWDTSHWPQLV